MIQYSLDTFSLHAINHPIMKRGIRGMYRKRYLNMISQDFKEKFRQMNEHAWRCEGYAQVKAIVVDGEADYLI